jgi:hypothetical protein
MREKQKGGQILTNAESGDVSSPRADAKKLASDEGRNEYKKNEPELKVPFHRESGAELAAVKIPGLEKTHLQK